MVEVLQDDQLTNQYGLDLSGWLLYSATGICADRMTVVGYGNNAVTVSTEAWMARLPEPGTLSLLAVSALALIRRRKIWRERGLCM